MRNSGPSGSSFVEARNAYAWLALHRLASGVTSGSNSTAQTGLNASRRVLRTSKLQNSRSAA